MDDSKPPNPPLPDALLVLPVANGWLLLDPAHEIDIGTAKLRAVGIGSIYAMSFTHAGVAEELRAWAQRRYPDLVA